MVRVGADGIVPGRDRGGGRGRRTEGAGDDGETVEWSPSEARKPGGRAAGDCVPTHSAAVTQMRRQVHSYPAT